MSTAQTIVNEALALLNLNNGLLPVKARSQQVAFNALVDMLARYRGDGIYISPQIPSSISADVREQPWAKIGLVYDLAFYCAAPLQVKEFPPTFAEVRKEACNTLYIQAKPSTETSYPDTLPTGGGNQSDYCSNGYLFYSGYPGGINFDIYEQVRLNESLVFYADFDGDAVMRNTSVSSVTWSVSNGSGITISNNSITLNLASATLTFNLEGMFTVKATAAYASGELKDFLFRIKVISP